MTTTRPTDRRSFLRRLGAAAGAAAVGPLLRADDALGSTVERLVSARPDTPLPALLDDVYLLNGDVTYLNHASIGTIPRVVVDAHQAYLSLCETNPWLYMWGGVWEEPRERVRGRAAALLGGDAADVAITHNTTEGFNLLAQGLPLGPGDEVLFSSLNHDGASVCFRHHAESRGYAVRSFDFPIDRAGELEPDDVVALHIEQVRPETRVLAFPHVDNIVGIRHPLAELTRAAHAAGVEFVAADGAQTAGMIELDLAAAGIDFYAASPHKWIQAPKGLGLFYGRADARASLRAMWVTWGQARWAGSARVYEDYGTRNLPAVLALGDALDFQAAIGPDARRSRLAHLHAFVRELAETTPGFGWDSPRSFERGASLHGVRIEGMPAPAFSERMLERGFVFRPFRTAGLNAVRISPNLQTTEAEIARFFDVGARVLAEA